MSRIAKGSRREYIEHFAEQVWGNKEHSVAWLNTPHTELGNKTPASLLTTARGAAAVEGVLLALEHGFPV